MRSCVAAWGFVGERGYGVGEEGMAA